MTWGIALTAFVVLGSLYLQELHCCSFLVDTGAIPSCWSGLGELERFLSSTAIRDGHCQDWAAGKTCVGRGEEMHAL